MNVKQIERMDKLYSILESLENDGIDHSTDNDYWEFVNDALEEIRTLTGRSNPADLRRDDLMFDLEVKLDQAIADLNNEGR